jgi:predicted ATPase
VEFQARSSQARLRRDEALAKARQRSHAHTLAFVLASAWDRDAVVRSEPTLLLERAEELRAHSADFAAVASVFPGSALSMLGSGDKGLALLTEGLAAYRATGALSSGPSFLQLLADCHRRSGQPKQGLKDLHEAAAQIVATQVCYQEAEMHRLRGELLVVVEDPVAAAASLHQAIAVARRRRARAATNLTRLWRDQGKCAQARDLLAPVYNWFTEGFDTPVLKDAKALLDELM